MFTPIAVFAALLVAATGQQITRTVTTRTQQPQLIRTIDQGTRTISLEEAQRLGIDLSGLNLNGGGIQTINTQSLGQGTRTITLEELQSLGINLNGQGLQNQGGVRLIQIPANGIQTQGISVSSLGVQNTGGINLVARGGGGGIQRTVVTTSAQNQGSRAILNLQPQPAPRRVSLSNAVEESEEVGEPKPEPYSFAYTADNEDGSSSSREETQDTNGVVRGFYTIKGADGQDRRVDYIADADGYRATVTTNEVGTESQSPADVDLQSTAETGEQASLRYTAELEAAGGRQAVQTQSQNFASIRSSSSRSGPVQTATRQSNGNFEIIRPSSVATGGRSVTVQQQAPQTRFVLVQVPQNQGRAQQVSQFVANRQAAASEVSQQTAEEDSQSKDTREPAESQNRFVAFGTRMNVNRAGTKSKA